MEIEIVKWEGFSIRKLLNDNMAVYVNEDVLEFLDSIDIDGKNVIDGGSNVGIYALVFSYRVGNNGTVYCFEQQEIIYELCKKNAILNNRNNIKCFNLTLSNKSNERVGYTQIDYEEKNISSIGIKTEPDGKIKVTTITIDDLRLENIGLIKLDIEGYEPRALEGAWKTIDRDKPYMIIELSPNYLHNGQAKVVEEIVSYGYSVKQISDFNYCCTPLK